MQSVITRNTGLWNSSTGVPMVTITTSAGVTAAGSVVARSRPEARARANSGSAPHSRNGIVLFITEIATFVAIGFVQWILNHVIGGLGCVLGLLTPLIALGFLVLSVVCIVKGTSGQGFVIPVLSQYADRF